MKTNKVNRRQFLKTVACTAVSAIGYPYIVPSSVLGANGAVPPSEKIVMGFVGVGSMGSGHLRAFLGYKNVRVVAVCDLREIFRRKAKNRVEQQYGDKGCESYHDFREMLARKDIDAILNATPDHWHALIGLEAARNGKDMYYEKPLSMSVAEDKGLRDAINRYGIIFQFGTQQRSDYRFHLACELARNQRIGKLHTIMVGSGPSMTYPNQPTQPMPDKKEFDYDMWLGPAQWAPYTYDIAQWGNGSDGTGPIEIEGTGVIPEDGLTDTAIEWEIEHKYANGVKMIHMNTGTALARASQFSLHRGVGVLFLGSEGWVFVCRDLIEAHPKSLLTSTIGPDEIHLYRSNNHHRNFVDCVKTRQKTVCPIESAVRSDTICHQDDIAIRLGRKLTWEPEREEFINDEQANRMLTRPMRSPWHL